MKTFAVTFAATLCAIAVAYFGLNLYQSLRGWYGEKSAMVAVWTEDRHRFIGARDTLASDNPEVDFLKESSRRDVAELAPKLDDDETALVALYERKPLPLTSEEKTQLEGWKKDLASSPEPVGMP